MTPLVRTAVIGLGWAGTVHANTLAAMPGIDVVALVDPDPQRRAAFPRLPTFTTPQEALQQRLDYCVVATPTRTHEPIALALAAAQVPALIEKPLAPDPASAWRIADAFQRAGLVAGVGHTERHNPATAELARLVHSGQLGGLWQITLHRQGPFPQRITDVGVALDLAVHDLDLARWIADRPIDRITASTTTLTGLHEDTATATAYLTGGLLAHLHTDRISPLRRRTVEVHTPAGVLTADAVTRTLTLHPNTSTSADSWPGVSAGEPVTLPVPSAPAPFEVENQLMRNAVQGEPAPGMVSLADGAAAVCAATALLTAARTESAAGVERREPAHR
ncbi:UDP-N-acetylglucosamine 3-dehydrogenase [Streptacidiphilus sp. MAP5-52]